MKHLSKVIAVIGTTALGMALYAAEDQAGPMHTHMQQMHAQMAAIHAEQDPAKRAELMAQHRQQMRATMRMMEPGDTQGMSMEQRMGAMEERMGMMSMMMEQMMEHQQAATAEPAPEAPAEEHQH